MALDCHIGKNSRVWAVAPHQLTKTALMGMQKAALPQGCAVPIVKSTSHVGFADSWRSSLPSLAVVLAELLAMREVGVVAPEEGSSRKLLDGQPPKPICSSGYRVEISMNVGRFRGWRTMVGLQSGALQQQGGGR